MAGLDSGLAGTAIGPHEHLTPSRQLVTALMGQPEGSRRREACSVSFTDWGAGGAGVDTCCFYHSSLVHLEASCWVTGTFAIWRSPFQMSLPSSTALGCCSL